MQLLVDQSQERVTDLAGRYPFVGGQFLTPLTRYVPHPELPLAVDNGGYSGADPEGFLRLLDRLKPARERCLFVLVPDVPGSAKRTLELWERWESRLRPWPLAFAAQDGIEAIDIPWDYIAGVFIGGTDHFKDGPEAEAVARAAKWLGKRVHVGRVNTPHRWVRWEKLGADTCDGTGVSKYDHMLDAIYETVDPSRRPLLAGPRVA